MHPYISGCSTGYTRPAMMYGIATDVGMHGLLASQSCYHSVLPSCWFTLWASDRSIANLPSLHPSDFVRNLLFLVCVLFFLKVLHFLVEQLAHPLMHALPYEPRPLLLCNFEPRLY